MDPKESKEKTDKDDLVLWKHFQEDANKIKERMWTITTWLFTLITGLIGFIFKFFTILGNSDNDQISSGIFLEPLIVILLGIVGLFICIFTYQMVSSYGKHITTCWKRSNFILRRNPDLLIMWKSGFKNPFDELKDPPNLPLESKRIFWLITAFGIIFLIISMLATSQIIWKIIKVFLLECPF
jgi:hypothetical protein